MSWTEIRSEKLPYQNELYKLSILDTGKNLLFQIYWFENEGDYDEEVKGRRVFFGVNYWPCIKNILGNLNKENSNDFIEYSNKRIFIELNNEIFFISRKKSQKSGSIWQIEMDNIGRRGGTERRVPIPKKIINKIIEILEKFFEYIDDCNNFTVKSSDFDPYFPNQMVNHDQSMIAFKLLLENDVDFKMFVKTDCKKYNSKEIQNKIDYYTQDMEKPFYQREYKKITPYHCALIKNLEIKLNRTKFSEEVESANLKGIILEDRGDDGYIKLKIDEKEFNINFDWEYRNDWKKNYLNVPIYFDRRRAVAGQPFYKPVNNIVLAPNIPTNSFQEEIVQVEKIIENLGGALKPYFIYSTMGQFGRKVRKPQIMLSIQCTNIAPLWPQMKNIPQGGYFIVSWHADFINIERGTRTAESGFERDADWFTSENFGIFEFNKEGINKFGNKLKEQYMKGIIIDKNGNTIPKFRKWM